MDPKPVLEECSGGISPSRCRGLAKARHEIGCYDRATLACFRLAWLSGDQPFDLMAYLAFRRDLGYPLNVRGRKALLSALPRMGTRGWLMGLNLLAEVGDLPTGWLLTPWWLRQLVARAVYPSPALSSVAGSRRLISMCSSLELSALACVETEQAQWRESFENYLRGCTGRICVVGNAGTLLGSGLGGWIDGHDCVIRFNQFSGAISKAKDIGTRTDVWVRAPGFIPTDLTFTGRWLVMSGPDMRYRLTNWRLMLPYLRNGGRVLTVPIGYWRDLVETLGAPPTAGLLMIAWLRAILGGVSEVSVVGIDIKKSRKARYHHALPRHSAFKRHNWAIERGLLAEWLERES
jgi:hypothetical protein